MPCAGRPAMGNHPIAGDRGPWSYGRVAADYLNVLDIPDTLKRQVNYHPPAPDSGSHVWPPKPGCGLSPDNALVRIWARIDLSEWITQAPYAFGPHGEKKRGVLPALAAVGTRLRCAGEGALVLWGIDVLQAEQWVDHPAVGLAVSELVCVGPQLPDRLINDIDGDLARLCWSHNSEHTNLPCFINSVGCSENSWRDGNTRSAFSSYWNTAAAEARQSRTQPPWKW